MKFGEIVEFEKQYKLLNKEQKKAVDQIDGPVMVIAGPGTGKTQVLTMRIANILKKTDCPPKSILAITFTEAGVRSMRQRLIGLIGSRALEVSIYTFHSFAGFLINSFPEYYSRIISSKKASSSEIVKIIEEEIINNSWKYIKPFGDPFYYVYKATKVISDFKREGHSPKMARKILNDEIKIIKNKEDLINTKGKKIGEIKKEYADRLKYLERFLEMADLYEKYEERMAKAKLYDYDDMIMETIKALNENEDYLRDLQEEYQYFLADEHQDANGAQNRIIELITDYHENPNLFIVGDDKQAIFRFQGASLENFHYFAKKFKDATLIALKNNYRSDKLVLDLVSQIGKLVTSTSVSSELVHTREGKMEKIRLVELMNIKSEALFLAEELKRNKNNGSVAIFTRGNKEARFISEIFDYEGILHDLRTPENIFDNSRLQSFISLLFVINDLSDDANLAKVLYFGYFDITTSDILRLIKDSKKSGCYLVESLRKDKKFIKITDWLDNFHRLSKWEKASKVFVEIFNSSNAKKKFLAEGSSLDWLAIRRLYEELREVEGIKAVYHLVDFLDHIDLVRKYGGELLTESPEINSNIVIMTAHRSKGLEFDKVYVTGLNEGVWNGRSRNLFVWPLETITGGADDERRLFYVALTRARNEIILTRPRFSAEGREYLPLQFINEIDSKYIDKETREAPDMMDFKNYKPSPVSFDKTFLRNEFLSKGFSPTSLNNFLECPLKFMYINLLQIPGDKSNAQYFGTACHEAIKVLNDGATFKKALKKFNEIVLSFGLEKQVRHEMLEKGQKILSIFLKLILKERQSGKSEFSIRSEINSSFGSIKLNGKIDRLLDSGTLIDYKSGKIKSRAHIMGEVKSSDGGYWRQLLFYKLCLSQMGISVSSGVISFIEPDDRGNVRQEVFELRSEDVDGLKKIIIESAEKIIHGEYVGCGEKDCEWCKLVKG